VVVSLVAKVLLEYGRVTHGLDFFPVDGHGWALICGVIVVVALQLFCVGA
jgi:hypothetical protein